MISVIMQVTSGPMLIPKLHVECVEMRAQHNDHTQSESVEPQRILQSDHQSHLSQCTIMCPILISESTTGPAAGILGFGAIVEAAALPDY